ncbi:MAG: FKBP-type peptidyl-prolyl cis-trans isomerase [Nanoarchaeota archaeon]|nr:FKBP-type peptidyl-prolyl cis-trans isomerase [Nanoarchaeota archaeon]
MTKIKKHDFIEIDYIGKVKSTDQIFDLTNKEIAEKNNIQMEHEYKPIIICVGEKNILKGIDDNLIDKEVGKEYEFTIKPEDGFGKRNPKLMKLINVNVFKKSNIMPMPGLQINIDGTLGTIRSFSGGRVIVDFNHPLADRELVYKVNILREVKDQKEKLTACMKFMNLTDDKFEIELNKDETIIRLKAHLDKTLKEMLEKKVLDLVPEVKKVKIELDIEKDIKK